MDSKFICPIMGSGNNRDSFGISRVSAMVLPQELYRNVERFFINLAFRIPRLRQAADAQISVALTKIEESVGKLPPGITSYRRIPKIGMSREQIVAELQE
jgi:hypothetical protein